MEEPLLSKLPYKKQSHSRSIIKICTQFCATLPISAQYQLNLNPNFSFQSICVQAPHHNTKVMCVSTELTSSYQMSTWYTKVEVTSIKNLESCINISLLFFLFFSFFFLCFLYKDFVEFTSLSKLLIYMSSVPPILLAF